MARGPLYRDDYTPRFSGHETFPLRYGWLKKVFDRVSETEEEPNQKAACWGDDAIARFGVGKNMVASMRHWAISTGIIEEPPSVNSVQTTKLGRILFGADGRDPYMEDPSTLWLLHVQIATHPEKTTWLWAFSYYPAVTFERETMIAQIERLARDCGVSKPSNTTIKNDVACLIRTYAARPSSTHAGHDGVLESPLTELGLIKAIDKKDKFRFVHGLKPTLGNGVFAYALAKFWDSYSKADTLSFEAIAYEPCGPGRVFCLGENDLVDRLISLEEITKGAFKWSETAGLKQLVRTKEIVDHEALEYILNDYNQTAQNKAA